MKKKRRLGRMLRRWEHEDYGESVTQEAFPGNFSMHLDEIHRSLRGCL